MGEWKLINANQAAAHAARLARAAVIPAYPITPQTTVVETIEEFIHEGIMDAEYIRVESEHSAMAAAIGASASGVRTFTATSSQGLLYMGEVVFWAAGSRLPIGMVIVDRAVGPPWNIHTDHQDAMSQRDSGWIQMFVSSAQEALDSVITMYKVAENPEVLLPFMVCIDAFILSHTYMPVNVPDQAEVDSFLPTYRPPHWMLDPDLPVDMGNLVMPMEDYMEMRWSIHTSMEKAKELLNQISREFAERFGRDHGGLIKAVDLEDADVAIVSLGTLSSEAEYALKRIDTAKTGLLKVRMFRPFPREEIIKLLKDKDVVVVLDRSISFGHSGPLAMEVRSALYGIDEAPKVVNFIVGLGGRDVTYKDIVSMVNFAIKVPEDEVFPCYWYGLKDRIRSLRLKGVI